MHELNPRAKVEQADSDLDPREEGDLHASQTVKNLSSRIWHSESVRSARLYDLTHMNIVDISYVLLCPKQSRGV